jgi:hypothetical protein
VDAGSVPSLDVKLNEPIVKSDELHGPGDENEKNHGLALFKEAKVCSNLMDPEDKDD